MPIKLKQILLIKKLLLQMILYPQSMKKLLKELIFNLKEQAILQFQSQMLMKLYYKVLQEKFRLKTSQNNMVLGWNPKNNLLQTKVMR